MAFRFFTHYWAAIWKKLCYLLAYWYQQIHQICRRKIHVMPKSAFFTPYINSLHFQNNQQYVYYCYHHTSLLVLYCHILWELCTKYVHLCVEFVISERSLCHSTFFEAQNSTWLKSIFVQYKYKMKFFKHSYPVAYELCPWDSG